MPQGQLYEKIATSTKICSIGRSRNQLLTHDVSTLPRRPLTKGRVTFKRQNLL